MSEQPIGRAFVEILPDAARFEADLARELDPVFREIKTDAERAFKNVGDAGEKQFDRIEREARDAAQSIVGRFRGIGIGLAAGLATVGLGAGLVSAVNQAADLGESINAVSVVLDEGAASFLDFGEQAASSLGITQAALNQAIIPAAALLKNAGSAGDVLSGQLQDLASRATDVGSVFNEDVNVVLEAFGAALRGESEPARRFGVNLSEAAVAAKAVELGLATSTSEVSDAAKVQARYALVLEQTNEAQGDFANTAQSVPNLMKQIKAVFSETAAALGSALLPAISEVASALLPTIRSLAPVFQQLGGILGDVIELIAPVLDSVFGALVDVLAQLEPTIIPITVAFKAVVTALLPLLPLIAQLAATLLPPLAFIITAVAQALAPLIELVVELVSRALTLLQPILPVVADALAEVAAVMSDQLQAILPDLIESIIELLVALVPLIPLLAQLITAFAPFMAEMATLAAQLLPPVIRLLAVLVDALLAVIAPVVRLAARVGESLRSVSSAAKSAVTFVRNRLDDLVGFLRRLPGRVTSAVSGMWRGLLTGFKDTINAIIRGWNNLSFTIGGGSYDPLGDFGPTIHVPSFTFSTPNIPTLNTGGLTQGNFLSQLHTRELVLPLESPRTQRVLSDALAAAGSGGVTFGPGSVVVEFSGAVPSESEARRTGRAVGLGVIDTLVRGGVRTRVRSLSGSF